MDANEPKHKSQPEDVSDSDQTSREATQRQEAKEALQRSFEHGSPEAGDKDDFDDKSR
jgi:hypothetical protein